MMSLAQVFQKAAKEHWAVPHFNVSNLEQLRGVCEAARRLRAPVMIGTSEGEREFIGLREAVALVRAFREEMDIPIFLNADHTKSVTAAKTAVDAGYDSIHIDLSKKSFKENVAGTRAVVQYARRRNRTISLEGELGYLVTESSKVYKEKIMVDPKTFTKPEEAKRFVKLTSIDRFAPAVGSLHGIAANRPKIDFALVRKIRAAVPKNVALVLHGGSGNAPRVFRKAIALGFSNIHISTELRLAYATALRAAVKAQPEELAPYKLMVPVVHAVQKKTEEYIRIFKAAGKV